MTIFWGLAGIMLCGALLFTLPWMLRSSKLQLDTNLDALNTEVIKTQLAELDADLSSERLDEAQYLAARQDLERELLADLSGSQADSAALKVRDGRWAVLVLVSLAMFGNYYVYDSIAPLADALKAQLGFSDTNIGTRNASDSGPNSIMVLSGGIIIDLSGTPVTGDIWRVSLNGDHYSVEVGSSIDLGDAVVVVDTLSEIASALAMSITKDAAGFVAGLVVILALRIEPVAEIIRAFENEIRIVIDVHDIGGGVAAEQKGRAR